MKLKHLVLGYASKNVLEVPEVLYLGHDREKALQLQAEAVQGDCMIVELHQVISPTKRLIATPKAKTQPEPQEPVGAQNTQGENAPEQVKTQPKKRDKTP